VTGVDFTGVLGLAVRGAADGIGDTAVLAAGVGATDASGSADGAALGVGSIGVGSGGAGGSGLATGAVATGSTAGDGSAAATTETPESEISAARARAQIRRNPISGLDASPVEATRPRL
jgi:hypothetical protein